MGVNFVGCSLGALTRLPSLVFCVARLPPFSMKKTLIKYVIKEKTRCISLIVSIFQQSSSPIRSSQIVY